MKTRRVRPARAALLVAPLLLGAGGCVHRVKPAVVPPPPNVGPAAPPLELDLETLDRVPARLALLRGRLTVVTLFTTGSDDALVFTDVIAALHAAWTPYGVRVLGVALDRSPDLVPPYVEGAKLPYPVYLATDPLRDGTSPLGPVWAVPLTLIIDAAGRIRFHHYGLVPLATLEKEIDALRREGADR